MKRALTLKLTLAGGRKAHIGFLLAALFFGFSFASGDSPGSFGRVGARAERAGAEQPEQPEQPEQEAPSAEAGEGFGLAAAERSLKRLVRALGC